MELQDLIKTIQQLDDRIKKLENIVYNNTEKISVLPGKKISAKEFLMTKKHKTDTQKTLILGYYLENLSGISPFNTADIETAFRLAKEKLPANINDTVNKIIGRGLMMEAPEKKDSKKAWVLTASGEKFVENEPINN
jgi:hypothetical protein